MLALAHEDVTMWWIAIGMGAVVVVAVIVLLSLLITFVQDIDRNVKILWNTATRVARNTATTWMLKQTASATGALRTEVHRHAEAMQSLQMAGASTGGGRSAPPTYAGTASEPADEPPPAPSSPRRPRRY